MTSERLLVKNMPVGAVIGFVLAGTCVLLAAVVLALGLMQALR